ncbi:MAG: hypothetical protein RSD04_01930 [Clostridia bacterium]
MLNKKTKALMRAIYDRAIVKDGICIVRPIDLLREISFKIDFRKDELDPSIKSLMLEGYFEVVETEKKGEKCFCITLLQAGYDFARQIASEKRAIKFKIILSISGVIFTFILSKIVAAIAGA